MSFHHINNFVNVESKEFPSAPNSWICHRLMKSFILLTTNFWMARNMTKCKSLATMLNNPLGVQIIFGLGIAKLLEPMTPPHPQIAWALLLTWWPGLGESHHLPLHNILCAWPWALHPNVILFQDSQVEIPKIPKMGTPSTLEAHNFLCIKFFQLPLDFVLLPMVTYTHHHVKNNHFTTNCAHSCANK